jgi:hypothetical protein
VTAAEYRQAIDALPFGKRLPGAVYLMSRRGFAHFISSPHHYGRASEAIGNRARVQPA